MTSDRLFNEMMTFARQDVRRAVRIKGMRKKTWQDELQAYGRKRADELKIEETDIGIGLKAIWISGRLWYSAAKEVAKPARKTSAWKKKPENQSHAADVSARWAHLKSL